MGSPTDDYGFTLNIFYVAHFDADGIGSGKYSFSYAVVRPNGTWSFVKKFSDIVDVEKVEERENKVEKMETIAALQHIKTVIKPDLAFIHFYCLKGITTYWSETIFILFIMLYLTIIIKRRKKGYQNTRNTISLSPIFDN